MTRIILILAVVLAGAGLFWVLSSDPAPQNGNGDDTIDTSGWETYENEEFGFAIAHPPEWEVLEAPDDPITAKFNIYKPEDVESELPLIHHSVGTHVSIFPEGIPTEGIFGESRPSDVDFGVETREVRDFTLADGSVWATFAGIENAPESWNESGFLFAGLLIEEHDTECFRRGEPVPDEQCDPLTGDDVVHHGSINEEDRRIQEAMLSSFRFIDENGTGGGNGGGVVEHNDLIRVFEPRRNEVITSPLAVSGEARGQWYFEATFSARLIDGNGTELSLEPSFIMTDREWMTESYVPFAETFTFTPPETETGTLILERANPSGLPENADELRIPVRFADDGDVPKRTIQLYYYDPSLDEDEEGNIMCSAEGLVPVEREIPVTQSPVQDTIRLLLRGELTAAEEAAGVTTEFPLSGVALEGARLENGELTLRFADPENQSSGGSCRAGILWQQIEHTALQFDAVETVRFEPEELFQP